MGIQVGVRGFLWAIAPKREGREGEGREEGGGWERGYQPQMHTSFPLERANLFSKSFHLVILRRTKALGEQVLVVRPQLRCMRCMVKISSFHHRPTL